MAQQVRRAHVAWRWWIGLFLLVWVAVSIGTGLWLYRHGLEQQQNTLRGQVGTVASSFSRYLRMLTESFANLYYARLMHEESVRLSQLARDLPVAGDALQMPTVTLLQPMQFSARDWRLFLEQTLCPLLGRLHRYDGAFKTSEMTAVGVLLKDALRPVFARRTDTGCADMSVLEGISFEVEPAMWQQEGLLDVRILRLPQVRLSAAAGEMAMADRHVAVMLFHGQVTDPFMLVAVVPARALVQAMRDVSASVFDLRLWDERTGVVLPAVKATDVEKGAFDARVPVTLPTRSHASLWIGGWLNPYQVTGILEAAVGLGMLLAFFGLLVSIILWIAAGRYFRGRQQLEACQLYAERIDRLTHLPARHEVKRYFIEVLSGADAPDRTVPGWWHGALVVDVDHLKQLNAQCHELGDEVMRRIANNYRLLCEDPGMPRMIPGRLGGDTFLVMLPWLSDRADEAHRRLEEMAELLWSNGTQMVYTRACRAWETPRSIDVSVSVGGDMLVATAHTTPAELFETLVVRAQHCLDLAKLERNVARVGCQRSTS